MNSVPNAGMSKSGKKPYSKPEVQVYGNLAEITNSSTNRTGKVTDNPGAHGGRTH
jgi:hypothetical protein